MFFTATVYKRLDFENNKSGPFYAQSEKIIIGAICLIISFFILGVILAVFGVFQFQQCISIWDLKNLKSGDNLTKSEKMSDV